MVGEELSDLFQNPEIQSKFLVKFWAGYFSWQTDAELHGARHSFKNMALPVMKAFIQVLLR